MSLGNDEPGSSGALPGEGADNLDELIERAKERQREASALARAELELLAQRTEAAENAWKEPSVERFLDIMRSKGNPGVRTEWLEAPKRSPSRPGGRPTILGRLRDSVAIAAVPKLDAWRIYQDTDAPLTFSRGTPVLMLDIDGRFRWSSNPASPVPFEPRFAEYLAAYLVDNGLV